MATSRGPPWPVLIYSTIATSRGPPWPVLIHCTIATSRGPPWPVPPSCTPLHVSMRACNQNSEPCVHACVRACVQCVQCVCMHAYMCACSACACARAHACMRAWTAVLWDPSTTGYKHVKPSTHMSIHTHSRAVGAGRVQRAARRAASKKSGHHLGCHACVRACVRKARVCGRGWTDGINRGIPYGRQASLNPPHTRMCTWRRTLLSASLSIRTRRSERRRARSNPPVWP